MRNILFRFLFILFLLTTSPWYWFYWLPGISNLLDFLYESQVWIVGLFNEHLLHIKEILNTNGGGSGDTSYAWAEFFTILILSFLGSLLWTLVDRRRHSDYKTLMLWLRNIVRYYLALISFSYGIIKLYALQMPFPNLSQLATPLGDYLPMRLSWMFMGYSTQYQIFAGLMETIVGMLLLYRRTVTLGALLGIGVYLNVFMINLSYDVPVKLFSMQLLIYSIFLSAGDYKRLLNFFWFNKIALPTCLYDLDLKKKWQRIARIVFKVGIVILVVNNFYETRNRYKLGARMEEFKPIKAGVYSIENFIRDKDTITITNDEMLWKDFIFDKGGRGSISTSDTLFRQQYGRGYFVYQPDTIAEIINFKRNDGDTANIFVMKYKIVNDSTIELWGELRTDSVYFRLQRTERHFQLTEKQFHWISESNR